MRYFLYSEFDQKGMPGSGKKHMNQEFLNYLDALRHKCGFPFIITSGYRTPQQNTKVSNTGLTGPHTTGKAADILVSKRFAYIVLQQAMEMGVFTGIGVNQKEVGRYIHLDILTAEEAPRPTLWSY